MYTIRYFVMVILLLAITNAENTRDISGNANLYYISKLSDGSIINLPFRMITLDYSQSSDNVPYIEFRSSVALEYHMRNDTDFLIDSSTQDFIPDIREFYITYITRSGEISIGKRIHAWGNVDENSPVDNVSSFDYFYLFNGGAERKLGTYGIAYDRFTSFGSYGFVFSPMHNTHRLPLEGSEFPVKLPIYPSDSEFLPISDKPYEVGGYLNFNFSSIDLRISRFRGYDRTFNLSGVNVFGINGDLSNPQVDIVYGYRQTGVIGSGLTMFIGDLSLRADAGYFSTTDMNSEDDILDKPYSIDPSNSIFTSELSYYLNERSTYYQSTLQFEYNLPMDIKIMGQYFTYDTLSYSSGSLPIEDDIDITNVEIAVDDLDPRKLFTPGMGAPIAVLGKSLMLYSIEKSFLNNNINLSLSGLVDLSRLNDDESTGMLFNVDTEYQLRDDFYITFGLTYINGNTNHSDGDGYRFNQMEDFSHIRSEIKYYF